MILSNWRTIWYHWLQVSSSRGDVSLFWRIFSNLKELWCWTTWHWRTHEIVCKTQKVTTKTRKGDVFQFQAWAETSYHATFVTLSGKWCDPECLFWFLRYTPRRCLRRLFRMLLWNYDENWFKIFLLGYEENLVFSLEISRYVETGLPPSSKVEKQVPWLVNKRRFLPLCDNDKDYDHYLLKWITRGPSIIFTRYATVRKTKIKQSENICKSILGIDANQLYAFPVTEYIPTRPYTKWEYNEETAKLHLKWNWRSYFEQQVMD